MTTPTQDTASARHDFDFLLGQWTTRQRRLKQRLQGSNDWESFEATTTNQHLAGGVINFDTLEAPGWRPGWVGMSLRVFNPITNLWSIHWITNDGSGIDPATGRLDAPVVGRFHGDEGVFDGEDVFDGRAIRVRFHWQRQGPDRARWQQAFSDDGGQSWEVNWVMEFERVAPRSADAVAALDIDCQVLELRQYTLHPGQRDTLIELFDREFVEPQEAVGMAVMGQFRDRDAPDRFVWLRGFADMASRAIGLAAFYGGPVWHEHRDAANATMVDSDDVLLLRPAWPGAGLSMRGRHRARTPLGPAPAGVLSARLLPLREPASTEDLRHCREALTPCLQNGGAGVLGWYATEGAPNNFPRLPVREGEQVLVVFAMFPDAQALEAFDRSGAWSRALEGGPSTLRADTPDALRLLPTTRSAIHA